MANAVIQTWGNSAGVRIPKTIIDQTKAYIGKEMEITIMGENIILSPRKLSFDELCNLMTPENMHYGMDDGAVGRELL
jgi:antitoxin component of MazEF toxin-antitoxin module